MSDNLKLSIIIPVYNVEKYLEKCVRSLVEQDISLSDYEIILINDGSTDESLNICYELQKLFSNVVILSQENQGQGEARNLGIKEAKGKYLMFVDSDDYINKNVLGRLIELVENNQVEVLFYNYQRVSEKGDPIEKNYRENQVVFTDKVISGKDFLRNHFNTMTLIWQFLINREFYNSLNIRFKKYIFFEDTDVIPKIVYNAPNVLMEKRIIYNYVQRKTSSMNNSEYEKKRFLDRLFIIQELKDFKNSIFEKKDQLWFNSMICMLTLNCFYGKFSCGFHEEINISEKLIPYQLSIKTKFQIFLINQHLFLFYLNLRKHAKNILVSCRVIKRKQI